MPSMSSVIPSQPRAFARIERSARRERAGTENSLPRFTCAFTAGQIFTWWARATATAFGVVFSPLTVCRATSSENHSGISIDSSQATRRRRGRFPDDFSSETASTVIRRSYGLAGVREGAFVE
jgi:hypothetical protein